MGNDFNQNWNEPNQMNRQRDLVLAANEFAFVMAKTNGTIKTYTGPITMTISAQESLVIFNSKTKKFEETQDFEKAKQLFVSAPEGWYVTLKNPAKDGSHPEPAKAVNSAELDIGRKINIAGPCSFSLFPGQMTRVIRGHRLRSNQYLLARVYDADAANNNSSTVIDAEGKEITKSQQYFVGQLLVIKGTEVSFYIPPTGIEVIAENENGTETYVREAVTLERLEYAILKDEDGEKRYIHGPSVVFPKPTETFVQTPKGGVIFRALELSPISGIYVKVIAEYDETQNGKKIHHPIGEELFITGKDQMIYYPRPEHAIIEYDGKYMHHAIAIPEGEGRYILNRLTGKITTVKGPTMYLPDPRIEVVVKRKLSASECELMYPNNTEVLAYNEALTEKATEKAAKKEIASLSALDNLLNTTYATSNQEDTLAIFEANANIARGVSYTKPRTITLDTKYDGVVSIDVWTGYAINVVSKSGKREVVVGPATRLLDYDETVEAINEASNKTAFLKIKNNCIYDLVSAQSADFVNVQIALNYYINFLPEYKDKWFSINNYMQYLSNSMRSIIKDEIKKYNIQDFYAKEAEIIKNVILNKNTELAEGASNRRIFTENGVEIYDAEILGVTIDKDIAKMLTDHQNEIIQKSIELSDAQAQLKTLDALVEIQNKQEKIESDKVLFVMELNQKKIEEDLREKALIAAQEREAKLAETQATKEMQTLLNDIQEAELARAKKAEDAKLEKERERAIIEKTKQEAYAATVEKIMNSISPNLIAAIQSQSNAELLTEGMKSMSPYALASGETVPEVVNKLLRGTTLEEVINKSNVNINF